MYTWNSSKQCTLDLNETCIKLSCISILVCSCLLQERSSTTELTGWIPEEKAVAIRTGDVSCSWQYFCSYHHRRNLQGVRGYAYLPLFAVGVPYPPLLGRMTEKNNCNFPSSSAHVSLYNIQENVWRLGLCPRNRVWAHIAPTHRPTGWSNRYDLCNCSLMFASISGQMALASSFISHFGPHLPLLFKLH